MGRGRGEKLELKKIKSSTKRKEAFIYRKETLFKKANELATLCDVQVAVITFNDSGNLAQFSSTDMKQILGRYKLHLEKKEGHAPNKQEEYSKVLHDLKKEISNPEAQHQGLLGKKLTSMSLLQLRAFERVVTERLLSIQERKEQSLKQIMQENETLHREVDVLQGSPPSTSSGVAAQLSRPNLQSRLSSGVDQNVEPDAGEILTSDSEIQPACLEGYVSYPHPAFYNRPLSDIDQIVEPDAGEIKASYSEIQPAGLRGSFFYPHPAFNYSIWP